MPAAAMTEEAVAHLRAADPVMRELIDRVGTNGIGEMVIGAPEDHYGALVRAITGQQLSARSAAAIYQRLIDRFGGRNPTPAEVLADDPDELRVSAGLSHAKVRYLRSLAEKVLDGSLALDAMERLPDAAVTAGLTTVKGIGGWSADMFLMFHLGRPDVVAAGDLGIRHAIMAAYELPELPGPAQIEEIAAPWRPYRTTACLILWRSLGVKPV